MAEEAAVQAVSESQSSSVVYDSEEETLKDYRPGGYHPVRLNDLFLNRYVIKQKLGWGHFSTVWLCLDTKFDTYVAMKVQKSAPNYTEAAYDEIDILLKVAGNFKSPLWLESLKHYYPGKEDQEALVDPSNAAGFTFVVQFLNSFVHVGENGKHVCMVFEILGVNLLEIIKRFGYKGIPLPICRVISKQILVGLDYLHRICGIIHTDLKPENVLLELTQEQIREILMLGQPAVEPSVTETPMSELPAEIDLTEDERKSLAKKQKKKDKKKKYKQRKKEAAKLQKDQQQPSAPLPPNPKKKKKKKKPTTVQTAPIKPDLTDPLTEPVTDPVTDPVTEPVTDPLPPPSHDDHSQSDKGSKKSGSGSEGQPKRQHSSPLKSMEPVTESIRVKIADLGNACWLDQHFSTEIQTRQYRSPEVILGISYNATADLWSFACMLFELITGDFLFEPKSGSDFDKDDDHLGQMIETLGEFPLSFALAGINSKRFFTKAGKLRNIQQLRYWRLQDVLIEKYHIRPVEAEFLSSFLLPMLTYRPEARATASQVLAHPWLAMPPSYDYKMTDEEIEAYDQAQSDVLQKKRDQVLMGLDWDSSPELSRRSEDEDKDADDEMAGDCEESFSDSDNQPEVSDLVESSEYHEKMKTLKQDLRQRGLKD